jgi:hypothetical protein
MKRIFIIFFAFWLGRVAAASLQQGEWFIDSDPGVGSGTAFSASSAGGAVAIPSGTIQALTPGIHLLGVRFQDDGGDWGHTVWRSFLKEEAPTEIPDLAVLEYRIIRNGTVVSTHTVSPGNPGPLIRQKVVHRKGSLQLGDIHDLQITPVDSAGRKGFAAYATFDYQSYAGAWLKTHFTAAERANPQISGDDADPDQDGLSNAYERVFALNPRDGGDAAKAAARIDPVPGGWKVGFRVPSGGSVGSDGIYRVSSLRYQLLHGETPNTVMEVPVGWVEGWSMTPLDG